jgi:hypothetical protein
VYILVDLTERDIEFEEPDDTRRFHVAVAHGDDLDAVQEILAARNVGYVEVTDDDEKAWISVNALQELAVGRTKAGWEDHFTKMLETAKKHGWLSEDGTHVRAHVQWTDQEGV